MAMEAVLKPLGQEKNVCDIEVPDATDTPWHFPASGHQHHPCLAEETVRTRREKLSLWVLVMTPRGAGQERD